MELPITEAQARIVARWMKASFGDALDAAVEGTAFSVDHLCAIAAQETAYAWFSWINPHRKGGAMSPADVCARCVLDGTGDVPGSEGKRDAFPRNRVAFVRKFDQSFLDMLVAEGNASRIVRGYRPASWALYKGYGLFQYDLQFVLHDEEFFRNRLWYKIDACLDRVMRELKEKIRASNGDVRGAIRRYNGAGSRAEAYAANVMTFYGAIRRGG